MHANILMDRGPSIISRQRPKWKQLYCSLSLYVRYAHFSQFCFIWFLEHLAILNLIAPTLFYQIKPSACLCSCC